MTVTLKALSALLTYPGPDLQTAVSEIRGVLASEGLIPDEALAALEPLLKDIEMADIYDLQERFVTLFDRSRSLSLNLFEHVHGESRDRGGAMLDLLETYRAGGFEPVTEELPDHLPVLLEFLSQRPLGEAREILSDAAHILEVLRRRLERRESPYAPVFAALVQLSGATADGDSVAEMLAQPDDDPNDLEQLDAVWEEAEVTFGPDPNAGCPQVRDMLARMDTPLTPAPARPAAAE
ncbi:nitrate reductase molybdenum cofactor assembly chaperone [Actibacterium sp. MT2.3-13A]|uniref:nitrate reductase molybdenum cofactor assembly chaperone n=1 Tax=Actibacterium sp. MT2.3-13A TaxID=2828332 RepID=UPI001BA4B4D8|nr:nitrate reductase molybdenum cofactor assembly chaperone [Actibacterium sp. MT2.3-13A]